MKGNLALLDRQPENAIQYFRQANDIKPFQQYIIVGYMQALLKSGQADEADRLARQFLERDKTFAPVYDMLYSHYVGTSRESLGEEILRTKVRNNPGDANPLLPLAAQY